ncbi:MAG: squalene/phytoene synthase family protein [Lysobacterales bacterium]|jgi:phytoene synthase
MTGAVENRQFCWEQVQAADGLFRVSLVFSGRETAQRLLPLHAMFASIEQLVATVSDEDVALRKLAWWRDALLGDEPGGAAHPVIAELKRSGAEQRLPAEMTERLVENAQARIEAVAPRDLTALKSRCVETGAILAELEFAVCDVPQPASSAAGVNAWQRGLVQLARESVAPEAKRPFWWIPLDLLARHGLARAEMTLPEKRAASQKLCSEILAFLDEEKPSEKHDLSDISEVKQDIKRFVASEFLLDKRLQFMNKNSLDSWWDKLNRPRPGDVIRCWSAVRRFNRRK